MTIRLTADAMREIFPRAPQSVIDDFVNKQDIVLTPRGINHTRKRLAYFFSNIEHECDGFALRSLTENINYTAERMAAVWPNRFANANAVREKYGSAPGWQRLAFDDIYGNRMGNRPGTRDGSLYIGRGGPQVTGRDGYREVGERAGMPLEDHPEMACQYDAQAAICAAFWSWKNLNVKADTGDYVGAVKLWNGGTNGLADRKARMAGNDPIIERLKSSDDIAGIVNGLDGAPPTPTPPKEVVDEATKKERAARNGGAGGLVIGGGTEGAKQTGTLAPSSAPPAWVPYAVAGVGLAIVIAATVLIARKRAAVLKNWR